MALDWNKEISFGEIKNALRRGPGGESAGSYPAKTTMNLYQVESGGVQLRKLVLVTVLGAAVAVSFLKFGIIDQWSRVATKEAELAEINAELAEVESKLASNAGLIKEYESYAPIISSSGVDATEVLSLVETYVMPSATVKSASLEGANLTLNLVDVPLDTVGEIVNTLQEQTLVESVSVTTAQNNRTDSTTAATLQVAIVSATAGLEGDDGNNFFGIDVDRSAEAWSEAAGALSKK